jgi:protein phosphatase
LRVIGDVHGDITAFNAAMEPARQEGCFVVQLGDLVDRGPDSPACLRLALALRENGQGIFIRGNHDDKLARALMGRQVRVSAELTRTLEQLEATPDGLALKEAFLAAWPTVPWWLHWGDHLFVHGAFHPAMLNHAGPESITPAHVRNKVKWLALYGEGRMSAGEALPQRTYGWVDTVPAGLTVVVGHDVRSETAPLEVTSTAGGRVIFLDTGCGKGGQLSWQEF